MNKAIRLCACLFLTAFALAGPVAAQSPGAGRESLMLSTGPGSLVAPR